jgi:hypothetical protein
MAAQIFSDSAIAALPGIVASWPDAVELEDWRKGEKYWAYFERKRASFDGTFSFGVGDEGGSQFVAMTFAEGGAITAVRVLDKATAIAESKIAMECTTADWAAIVDGYDIGKAMTYHQLPLRKGSSMDLLRCVYFLHELIVVLTRIETRASVSA